MSSRPKYWTWVSNRPEATDDEWRAQLTAWREAGVEAILPEVFNNHTAMYASQHLPVADEWLERWL